MGFCQYPIHTWRKLIGGEMGRCPTMRIVALPTMPFRTASTLTFFYALAYPCGALAVSTMSPMAVLVFRFGLAGAILGGWALAARVTWPTGRLLAHVLFSGLLAQGLMYSTFYVALMHGAPAVLGAVIVSMNPVVTAVLATVFLGEPLTRARVGALALGVLAVLAACAGRLMMVGGVDTAILLMLVSLFSVAAGGVYQQKFCRGVDFRVTSALQNAVCVVPVAVLAALMPLTVTNPWKAAGAVATVVLLNATVAMTLYVRAIDNYGAAAVAMLFTVIPAVAGVLSWLMLGQRPDIGIAVGLVLGAAACWLNARGSRQTQEMSPPTAAIMRASSPATSGPAG
jgi:drug/metabolite transporter (DMT)-like permease